jgi:hypothetical protein
MRISRARWVSLSLILLASALFAPLVPAVAVAQSPVPITVETSTAQSDFPDAMTFGRTASVEGKVTQVDLVYQEAHQETLELLPATFEQSEATLTATAKADFSIYYVPAGIDLTYHWVITFTDNSVSETESSVVTWLDKRFDWEKRAGNGVEIYSYGRSDSFLDFVVAISNKAVADMIALYNPPSVLPIRIWLYDSREDFSGTLASNSETWAVGAAYPSLQVILAVIPDKSRSEVERVLPHEISHQILSQATLNPYNAPAAWIDEGLAVVAQVGGKGTYQDTVDEARSKGELISLGGLTASFPYDPGQASIAYGESYLVMQYVLDQYGPEAIQRIIAAYRAGNSHDDVIQIALGMSIDELEQAWIAQLAASSDLELAA